MKMKLLTNFQICTSVPLREAKRRRKNIAMCWIDYCKASRMVPHSWMREWLNMFEGATNVQKFLKYAMPPWKV